MKGAFMERSPGLKAPEACRKGCQADCPRSKVLPPVLTVSHPPVCLAQNCIVFKMSPADLSARVAALAPDYEQVSCESVWAAPSNARFRWPVSEDAGVSVFPRAGLWASVPPRAVLQGFTMQPVRVKRKLVAGAASAAKLSWSVRLTLAC